MYFVYLLVIFLTFVNTAPMVYHQNHEALTDFLFICNSSCVRKRQKITSTHCATVGDCWAGGTCGAR